MLAATVACATHRAANKGEDAVRHRDWDAAVYHYLEALAGDPENVEYRMALVRARQKAAQEHFQRGATLRGLGRLIAARDEMRLAVQLDPTHQFAEQELRKIEADLEVLSRPDGARTLAELKEKARQAKVQPPLLDPRSKEPISLSFPKAKPIKEIYQAMGKAYGFNVLFDPKLKDDKLSIELSEVSAKQALEIVMQAAGHFYKVLDEHSIIIVEDTPQNRREYEDLVIKTFFLSNADVKDVDKLLRSLIEARRLATNEQLNAITLRDTADKVAIAEKLISINDKAKAEVLVDVELLQINRGSESDIGVSLTDYIYTLGFDPTVVTADGSETIYLPDVSDIFTTEAWFVNIPEVVVSLVKSAGEAETLAQPQLRITEGEKASLVIGDRVPIPVTSFNTANTVGTGVVPITSFQYQDVGIKIDVEPRVHHNREVTLNLSVEVSQLGDTVKVGPNQEAVTIGTRTINSVIRLKDGESSLLAGLIRVDQTEGRTKTPLLSSIPILGRLFTAKSTSVRSTDLVLTLTPHIIRIADIKEEDLAPVWVGTESRISFFGSQSPRVHSGRAPRGPMDEPPEERPSPPSETEEEEEGRDRSAPWGVRDRIERPRGLSLVPGSSGGSSKSMEGTELGWEDGDEDSDVPVEDVSPVTHGDALVLGLEPSVMSLRSGETAALQVVVSGGRGPIRLSVGMSHEPGRLSLDGVATGAGAMLLGQESEPADGWFSCDLMVAAAGPLPQVVLVLEVHALAPGPVPLVLSVETAVDGTGAELPVAVHDGAIFVLDEQPEGGGW